MDPIFDDNGNNLLNKEEESDVTSTRSINANNDISIIDYEIFIHTNYAPFLS